MQTKVEFYLYLFVLIFSLFLFIIIFLSAFPYAKTMCLFMIFPNFTIPSKARFFDSLYFFAFEVFLM
jgi:hypothetical protein